MRFATSVSKPDLSCCHHKRQENFLHRSWMHCWDLWKKLLSPVSSYICPMHRTVNFLLSSQSSCSSAVFQLDRGSTNSRREMLSQLPVSQSQFFEELRSKFSCFQVVRVRLGFQLGSAQSAFSGFNKVIGARPPRPQLKGFTV